MQKWEYMELCLSIRGKKDWAWTDTKQTTGVSTRLNELGKQGWELVSAYTNDTNGFTVDNYYLLKRPLE